MHLVNPGDRIDFCNVERRYIEIDDIARSLCGFCGTPIEYEPGKPRQDFTYDRPALMGIGNRVEVCGDDPCTKVAVASFIAESLHLDVERSAICDAFRAAIQGDRTDVQYGFIVAQANQRLLDNATGGKRLELGPMDGEGR